MLTVSALYIYPVKSLGGIEMDFVQLTDRGMENDRRWMLVDENNCFLTQREYPQMALLATAIEKEELVIYPKTDNANRLRLPLRPLPAPTITVRVWDDLCEAWQVSPEADHWFSQQLNQTCRLVYMPQPSRRKVDTRYALSGEITGFSDAFPVLMIGQSSLDDLNGKMETELPMNRFRPNIVFTGGQPFEEDTMAEFIIGDAVLSAVKPCARCVITTTDQATAQRGKEPLRTLSRYRMGDNKIYFGQNVLYKGNGTINRGDEIRIVKTKPALQLADAYYKP